MPTIIGRRWTVAACALVSVPFLVSAVGAAARGWMPTWDTAFVQLRVLEVGTRRTPLIGMPSTLSQALATPASHPGPLHFWLLAIPYVVTRWWPWGLAAAQATLNAIVAVVSVLAVRSCAGPRVVWATVGVWMAAVVAVGDEVLHDPWNPHMTLIALLGCALCTIVVCHGARPWVTVALVATASLAGQSHLSGLIPAVALGLAGAMSVVRRLGWPRCKHHLMAASAAVVVCWSGPLLDQIVHQPGNLRTLVGSGGDVEAPFGFVTGFDRLARVLVPPGLGDHGAPSLPGGAARWILRLAAFAMVAVVADGWRRHRGSGIGTVFGVTLLLAAATWLSQAITPASYASVFGGHIWAIMWPAAILVWMSVAFVAGERAASWIAPTLRPPSLFGPVARVALGALAVSAIAVPSFARVRQERDGAWFASVTAAAAAVPTGHGPIVVIGDGIALESELVAGLAAELQRRGADVYLGGPIDPGLVHARRLAPPDNSVRLWVSTSPEAPQPDARLLVDLPSPVDPTSAVLYLYLLEDV